MLKLMQLNNSEESLVLRTIGWVHLMMEVQVNYGQMELETVHLLILVQLLQQTPLKVMLLKCKI